MIIGVMSDTHSIENEVVESLVRVFKKRGVERIVHCGDMTQKHVSSKLFSGLPVMCALIEGQYKKSRKKTPVFKNIPENWHFTFPRDRIRELDGSKIYLGHKRAFNLLRCTEMEFMAFLDTLRRDNDGLRWAFSGHTHHQSLVQTPQVNFLNPGAVFAGFNGIEYAVIDTTKSEIIFSRIPLTQPTIPDFSVGVISDTLRISQLDASFWEKLSKELHNRNAMTIIHCGNIATEDIGRPELRDFQIYCNVRKTQIHKIRKYPKNWHVFCQEEPASDEEAVREINGYKFYVQLDLGVDLMNKSEVGIGHLCTELRQKYGELDYILCGFTRNAMFIEDGKSAVLNPGDAINDRNFAVIYLPVGEITIGHVPVDIQLP